VETGRKRERANDRRRGEGKRRREEARGRAAGGRQGEKARQHGVLTPPPDDFERFVLPGSAESLANAAG